MGEFLAELGFELLGELAECGIGAFLSSGRVSRWGKTLTMSALAAVPVGILAAVTFAVWRWGGSAWLTGLLCLLSLAAAGVFAALVIHGHRTNWTEPNRKTGRKRYEP